MTLDEQEKINYFWIVEKKTLEDKKADLRNKERELQVGEPPSRLPRSMAVFVVRWLCSEAQKLPAQWVKGVVFLCALHAGGGCAAGPGGEA